MRVGLLNNKGGVGKTTVTTLLAERAAHRGMRVMMVDLDPQANATRRLGVKPSRTRTLTTCLTPGVRDGDASKYLYESPRRMTPDHPPILVLAADLDLEDRSLEAGIPGAHYRLRRALWGVDDECDLTLIDFPPSLKGHLTAMGIAALDDIAGGDTVVIPTDAERDSIAGALRCVRWIRQYRRDLGVSVDVSGLVVNRARENTSLHADRIAQMADVFDVPILGRPIPLRARVAELNDGGVPIDVDEVVTNGDKILTAVVARPGVLA